MVRRTQAGQDAWGPYGTAVAIGAGGEFLVAWSGATAGEVSSAQFAQRFSSAGVPVGMPFRVNYVTNSFQIYLRLARLTPDQLVLTWTSNEAQDPSVDGSYDIIAGFCYLDAPATCPDVPQTDCATGASAKLRLRRNADAARNKLDWDWSAAEDLPVASFGSPDLEACGASYALCVYEESEAGARLVASTRAARGGDCGGRPCWKRSRSGLNYRNRQGTKTTLRLRGGAVGRAAIGARARGADVSLPSAPLVTAQAVRSGGECWSSTFAPGDVRLDNGVSFIAEK